ncbi:MAG: tetratricopeptide repeat protein [Flavobacteriia bacterium]
MFRFSTFLFFLLFHFFSFSIKENQKLEYLNKKLTEAQENSLNKANIILELAEYLEEKGNNSQAILEYHKVLLIYEKKKSSNNILDIQEKLAKLYFLENNYEKAIFYNLKCLYIAENLNNIQTQIRVEQELAIVYLTIGQAKNAQKILDRRTIYFAKNERKDFQLTIQYLKVKGVSLYYLKDYEKALKNFEKALVLCNEIENQNLKLEILNNIGSVYLNHNKFDKAVLFFQESIQISKKMNDKIGIARGLANMAIIHNSKHEFLEAIKNLKFAVDIYKEEKDLFSLQICYKNLSENYEKLKQLDSSLFYYKLFFNTKEINSNSEMQEKASNLLQNYKIEKLKSENKIKSIKAESDLRYSKLKNVSLIIIMALLLSLFYWGYRRNLMKNHLSLSLLKESDLNYKNSILEQKLLKDEIIFKNKELAHTVGHLINRNEILIKIKEAVQMDEDKVRLVQMLNENLNFNNDLKKFEVYLNDTHQTFNFNLKTKYPDLTDKDIRFASLLVLNLSSKEIATILNITPQSVDLKRHRFRKKMNIETSENLISFLSNFY